MAHIMVVQDEPMLVSIVRIIAKRRSHTVTSVRNGEEALRTLGLKPFGTAITLPDLLIMDILSPILDSRTVALTMQDDIRTRNIPLLILTAPSDGRSSLSDIASVTGFIDRRINPPLLLEIISQILPGGSLPARIPARLRIPSRAIPLVPLAAY